MAEILKKPRRMHENSLKNLHPQKAGEPSHNPRGRKRKPDCLISCIKASLAKKALNGVQTKEELIGDILVEMASKGNLKAIEILMSYTTPKPNQGMDVNTKGKMEILVKWDGNRNSTGSPS